MLRVLILDDSKAKIEVVKKVLVEGCLLKEESIDVAESVAAGRDCLSTYYYDLVLLDLVMPLLEGEEPDEEGGLSFIREITTAGSHLKMPTQIVGLTEKEDTYEREKNEFQDLLFNVIVRKQGDNTWINALKQVVNYLSRSKEAILASIYNRKKYDVGIICALSEEFKQLINAFGGDEKWRNVESDIDAPYIFKEITITTAQCNEVRVVAAMAARPGVVPTAVLSTLMYIEFRVHTIFMTGFSAGFPSNDLRLGDVLVASSIEDYASGKLKDSDGMVKLLNEIHQVEAPQDLVLKMQELLLDENTQSAIMAKVKRANLLVEDRDSYSLSVSATCCGPFVVTSEEVVAQLKQNNRKLEGLDMEGYGLYLTSRLLTKRTQKGALWIKGVGDYANPDKDNRYHKTCSFSSASLLYHFIKEKM